MEDDSLYCLELTEKAFRSQGLALSEPIPIGDWEYVTSFPLTAFLIQPVSKLVLDRPITLGHPVYIPGNERQGVWASPLLETVFGPAPKVFQDARPGEPGRLNMKGDLDLFACTFWELRRSYAPASRSFAQRPDPPSDETPRAPSGERSGAKSGESGK